MSKFAELKAEYIALAGKNPPPMSADALQAKVDELKAAAAAAEQNPPAQDPPAQDPPAPDSPEQDPTTSNEGDTPSAGDEPVPSEEAEADQSVEETCAELGLEVDSEGNVEVEMLTGLSGPTVCLTRGDRHTCSAAEAVRLVQSGAAQRRG
jgi:hypothetical protein